MYLYFMKISLLFYSIVVFNRLFSQITLTAVDFAGTADTVRMSQAQDPAIDFSATGSNFTWDFSQLTPVSQELRNFQPVSAAGTFAQFLFGTFAPAKYQASYFTPSLDLPLDQLTSFLPINIQDIYLYTKKMNDSITSVGYSMNASFNGTTANIPFQSDTIETRYDLPLAFGNTHFSRGASSVDFNPIYNAKWNQHRTRFTEVDGFGSITTPFGTFDALRIRHDIDEIDSLYLELPFIGATWVPLDIPASHEYEWWTNGQKEPILRIRTSQIANNEAVTAIEYRDFYRPEFASLDETMLSNVEVYPNPINDVLYVNNVQSLHELILIDIQGKEVLKASDLGSTSISLNVSSLETGIYHLVCRDDKATKVLRIFKNE
jgi:hypothetical protein